MNRRVWFYLTALIIIGVIIIYGSLEIKNINREQILIQDRRTSENRENIKNYLATQNDPIKLISLAKNLKSSDTQITELIIDKAYALAPSSKDILVLDSQFHPELKNKITAIDPLYQGN
jgi:hypothetical protein